MINKAICFWAIREITRKVPVHILCTFLIQFLSSLDSLIKALCLTNDLQIFFYYVLSFYFVIVFTEVYKVVILTQLSGVSVGAGATSLDRAQQQVSSSPIHGC